MSQDQWGAALRAAVLLELEKRDPALRAEYREVRLGRAAETNILVVRGSAGATGDSTGATGGRAGTIEEPLTRIFREKNAIFCLVPDRTLGMAGLARASLLCWELREEPAAIMPDEMEVARALRRKLDGEAQDGEAQDGEAQESGTRTPDVGTRTLDGGTRTPDVGTRTPDGGTRTPEGGTRMPDGGTRTPAGEMTATFVTNVRPTKLLQELAEEGQTVRWPAPGFIHLPPGPYFPYEAQIVVTSELNSQRYVFLNSVSRNMMR
ncbi:MAG: hypothetical protein IJM69_08400, partial [Firmicutes bacterium]|nr:hypothetical protein [Bacillota bacterium]